jgi:hypothetical protein
METLRTLLLCAPLILVFCLAALADAGGKPSRIDRHALVTRHDIRWDDPAGQIPLGNGEFCFNADATGLETLGGNTMSHWAWHSSPLPDGYTLADVPETGTIEKGRIEGPMKQASGRADLDSWMFRNPHAANLGRLRLVRPDGGELRREEITHVTRTYDLWTGLQTSRFEIDGEAVAVETCVHPTLDLIAVRADSALLREGKLMVCLEFPYPNADGVAPWAGHWGWPERHTSQLTAREGQMRADIERTADDLHYRVVVAWSKGCVFTRWSNTKPHEFRLRAAPQAPTEFVCGFSSKRLASAPPTVAETQAAAARHWASFWSTGGAIDLSESKDPRWMELERRIVLSQYETAAQSAGSWPSAEDGLMGIDPWSSQFHMEMVWWHLAHYALWDRWAMADDAIGCYDRFLPEAQALAAQFGYKGAKWGKQVGPEGRTAPWQGSFVLHWQQPHPLFFAELDYRRNPSRSTLGKWREVVLETAEYMVDFPTLGEDGFYHLRPVMPACEEPTSYDTVFELAYWRFGLETAQRWRRRLGLPRDPKWDEVEANLAPLPVKDGLYILSPERPDAHGGSHPDAVGVYGMLPPVEGVDPEVAKATLDHMAETWDCMGWGWDFPWLAMAAARSGEPQLAVESLLHPSGQNHYDERGINTGGPCPYLPGNGGLLYAVAMMAAGWDGAPARNAPGFPDDGSWVVRHEGLRRAP